MIPFTVAALPVRQTLSLITRQEQRQELRLTPQLIQSMEILQYPILELEQRVREELDLNPLLEVVQEDPDEAEEHHYNIEESAVRAEEREPEIKFEHVETTVEFSIADEFAQNYSDTIDEAPVRSQNWLEARDQLIADTFANIESPGETLQEHLEQQLVMFDTSEPIREMALRIIQHLEPSGYFSDTLENLLGDDCTPENLELAREALALVKRLEPAGVGGKDLKECLLLQIDPTSNHAEVLRVLVKSCLEDISANRMPAIAKKTGYSLEVIHEAVAELRHFNPRPGIGFERNLTAVIIPDIFVEKSESGKYVVRLEEMHIPHLHVNKERYKRWMKKRDIGKDEKAQLRHDFSSARELVDAIEQRRETLLKVSQAIVDHQTDFFDKGQQALKPLKMQQIADQVGIHVTTVSRACGEKWVSSPQGVFPLRRLFAGGFATVAGEDDVSDDVVRSKILEIVGKENKKSPLSDDAIVKMLSAEGIKVARRTIAKYRDLMSIPSSRGRRQWEK